MSEPIVQFNATLRPLSYNILFSTWQLKIEYKNVQQHSAIMCYHNDAFVKTDNVSPIKPISLQDEPRPRRRKQHAHVTSAS